MHSKKSPEKPKKPASVVGTALFENLLKNSDAIQHYQLRLYITGTTARSSQAIANIRALCNEFLDGHYDLEVIDIYQQPAEATKEQIIAAPTLIKESPIPPKRLIGDLSDRDKVIVGLSLNANRAASKGVKKTEWVKI
ncbi:MAG: circadian clock KaiB family protein [Verrucomicrobiota bacterium]